MSDLKLDTAGNLDVTGHQLNIATGEEAIAQHLRIRLRFFLGEWFLDERLGIPYFRDILVKSPNLDLINAIYRQVVQHTPGISSVRSVNVQLDAKSRTLSVSPFRATIDTGQDLVFGPFIVSV